MSAGTRSLSVTVRSSQRARGQFCSGVVIARHMLGQMSAAQLFLIFYETYLMKRILSVDFAAAFPGRYSSSLLMHDSVVASKRAMIRQNGRRMLKKSINPKKNMEVTQQVYIPQCARKNGVFQGFSPSFAGPLLRNCRVNQRCTSAQQAATYIISIYVHL